MKPPSNRLAIPVLVVFALAFVVRLYPLVWSPYPYNIDGFVESKMAEDIFDTGSLEVPADATYSGSYVIHMPFFNSVLAMFSHIMGVGPLLFAQVFAATIGAISCVLAFLLLRIMTGSRRVALLGGLFMALLGTYVFCTASVWKENLGLLSLVLVAALFLERRDLRLRFLLTLLLVMMTFIHHHSAVMTYMFFSFATVAEGYVAMKKRAWSWHNYADVGTMFFVWPLAVIYYSGIDLPYYDFLTPDTGMYLMIAVSCAMAALMTFFLSERTRRSKRHYLKIVIPVLGAGLLVLNYFRPIFPGIAGTQEPVLVFGLVYLALVVPMWFGAESVLKPSERTTPMLYALVFAPLTMILFALLRALDATSHMIIYRTFDFLDIAMALMFAAGVVVILLKARRSFHILGASFLLLVLATTPLAFQTEQLFGVHNQTYEYEVDAFLWIETHQDDARIDSDQRLGTVYGVLTGSNGSSDLGFRIRDGRSIGDFDLVILKSSWSVAGAQQFPLGQVVLDTELIDDFLEEQDVLYLAGPADNQLIVAKSA
ncbi:MAG: hypothetical protein QXE18_07010 [Thermoplasmata archaeon]